MRNIAHLIERCRVLGATLIPCQDRLRVEAPQPLPEDMVDELREAKNEILAELQRQPRDQAGNWMLEEWRRTAIPAWRRILKESIQSGDTKRETYARWMLNEVLEADYD